MHKYQNPMSGCRWRKSRRSNPNGACVEVGEDRREPGSGSADDATAGAARGVLVRDTRQADQPDRTVLRFTPGAWAAFTGEIKDRPQRA